MRIVFCGTAEFAVPLLRALADAHQVLAVVTQPHRPGSRGRPAPRPVGETAERLQLPVLRPQHIGAPESVRAIRRLSCDALVVAAYGQIIPATLLDAPRWGGINVHGSLLPRWRGAAPVAAAILAGDERTGVSIMRMDVGLDTGPVLATRAVSIAAADTTPLLAERLAEHGAALLLEVLAGLGAGTVTATPQDESRATYAPRLSRGDGAIEWSAVSAIDVDRRVRALQPWPGVTAPLAGLRVRVIAGRVGDPSVAAGRVPGELLATAAEDIDVVTAAGVYRAASVQPPGGRPMTAAAYLRGRRQPGR
ncbi:MAG: methionyl-tRNA formyltransferase [Candidatus Dormibacteria bacterium]